MKPGSAGRGFGEFRNHVEKKGSKARSHLLNCSSCFFMNDKCENGEVTEYDMVRTETKEYCTYWKGGTSPNKRKKRREEDW